MMARIKDVSRIRAEKKEFDSIRIYDSVKNFLCKKRYGVTKSVD